MADKYALIIATEKHKYANFPELKKSHADADSILDLLCQHGGFNSKNVKVLNHDESSHEVRIEVAHFFKKRKRDDLLLFYFAGHGERPDNETLCLILSDTDPDAIPETSIDCGRLRKVMDQSRSKRQLLLLDCCYSGSFAGVRSGSQITESDFATTHSDAFKERQGEGRFIITATDATTVAREVMDGVPERENALFTQAIVDAVASGEASDEFGAITVQSLYRSIKEKVEEDSNHQQKPRLINPTGEGDLLIFDSPHKPLSCDIKQMISSNDPDIRLAAIIKIEIQARENQCFKRDSIRLLKAMIDDRDRFVRDAAKRAIKLLTEVELYHLRINTVPDNATVDLINREESYQPGGIVLPPDHYKVRVNAKGYRSKTESLDLTEGSISHTIILKKQSSTPKDKVSTSSKEGLEVRNKQNAGDTFNDRLKDGSSGPTMVVIPKGTFIMGSPEEESGRTKFEGPQHRVNIRRFALGQTTVTFNEYDRFTQATGRRLLEDNGLGRGRRPVTNVSWKDANAYAEWLSEQTRVHYRLPSEAEWEYAARAGTTTPFNTGDYISATHANFNDSGEFPFGDYPCSGTYLEKTTEVGQYPANAFGLYDIHGNVWEWVQDDWHHDYIGAPPDGHAWKKIFFSFGEKVKRGGCWASGPKCLRSAARCLSVKYLGEIHDGFRLARTL